MGAAVSRQVANTTNQVLTNITANTSVSSQSSCSTQAFSSQNVQIVTISNSTIGSITLDANTQISSTCLQSSDASSNFSATLTNQLQNAVTQSVKQNGLTLGANVSDSEITQINQSITNFAQNFNVSSLSSCIASVTNSQNLGIGTITSSNIGSITLAIDQSVIAKCVQQNTAFSAMNSTVSNTLANTASQTVSQGIDLLSGIIAIIVVLVIVYLVYSQGVKVLTNPKFIFAVLAVIVVLVVLQFIK